MAKVAVLGYGVVGSGVVEVLNTNKTFIAVKDCTLESKLNPTRSVEEHEFMQVNVSTILLMRPIYE